MKKKEFLTEAKRKAIIAEKEKAIIESFAKTFNKIKRIDENEISANNVLRKNYNKYVIEELSPYFGEKIGEYFADILYYYNENKELINPKNDKNIDKIGKSFYGFSSFNNIGSINKDDAMSHDMYIFSDDKNMIIDSVNYLVNYLKSFKIDSIEQIDFMVDNDSTGDLEQEKFIYDNLIPSEDLKKYFIKKSYSKNFTTDNNNSFNPYFMDKIDENDHEDWDLEDRKQQYGINPEIDPAELNQGVDIKEIIDNRMHPFFDFEQNKAYVELDDIDSVLVYDFDILSSPINSQDPEEDYNGEISLTFNEAESQLNNGVEKYIDYINELISTRPSNYGFWEKWAKEGYNAPDEPDYDEY